MSKMREQARGLAERLRLWWLMLLRGTLHLWVRARVLPEQLDDLGIDRGKPVCYVIDSYALSDLLILDKVCESLDLPRPVLPFELADETEPRAYLALRRKQGLIVQRTRARSHSETLERLINRVEQSPAESGVDVQLVPVTVFGITV